MPDPWTMRVPAERLDWHAIKDRIRIETVAVALLGPPAKKEGRRLLWRCPWHKDANPSLTVDPERRRWKCYPCNLGGDAVALAMQANRSTFPEAVRLVAEICGLAPSSGIVRPTMAPRPAEAPARPVERPSGLPSADAVALVEDAAKRLWMPEGTMALSYLRARGLTDETIFAARLGCVRDVAIPKANGEGTYRASGVVLPWFDRDRLVMAKIRQADGRKPKYAEAYRDRPRIFPGPDSIRVGRPLVIVEGEFDALLLAQQIGDVASVATLGGASSPLDPEIRRLTRGCSPLFIATDADEAGDRAAASWPARSHRVRPPEGCKDWTHVHEGGFNRVRFLWGNHLAMSATWEQLADQRWGTDDGNPEDLGCVADEMC